MVQALQDVRGLNSRQQPQVIKNANFDDKNRLTMVKVYQAAISRRFYGWLRLRENVAQAGAAYNFYGGLRLRPSAAAYGGGLGVYRRQSIISIIIFN